MTDTLTISRLKIPAEGEPAQGDDLAQFIALRNADMRRIRGNDDHSLTVEQALPFWRDQKDRKQLFHLARDGDTVVGSGSLEIPQEAGDRTAGVNVRVAHGRAGRGVGSALLRHVEALAGEAGRSVAQAWTEHPPAEGDRIDARTGWGSVPADHSALFAHRRGYVLEQVYRNSALDIGANLPLIRDLLDTARAAAQPAYRYVSWEIPTPDEHLEDFAWLKSRMSTDAPTGDLEVSEEHWDADRVRRLDARDRAAGFRKIVGAAQHVATGRLVAFNELLVDTAIPALTHQNDTLVLREHRGHRLGMLVKCETLLRWIELVPETRRVETFNAEENRPMLAINETMGFVPVLYAGEWQRRLG
ncbi:MAG TPA: GNAT family N-acetyltransferase [Microbacterium sp.]|nr:GNAT family N-acetyltransferase [Microbacterium sp.]